MAAAVALLPLLLLPLVANALVFTPSIATRRGTGPSVHRLCAPVMDSEAIPLAALDVELKEVENTDNESTLFKIEEDAKDVNLLEEDAEDDNLLHYLHGGWRSAFSSASAARALAQAEQLEAMSQQVAAEAQLGTQLPSI